MVWEADGSQFGEQRVTHRRRYGKRQLGAEGSVHCSLVSGGGDAVGAAAAAGHQVDDDVDLPF